MYQHLDCFWMFLIWILVIIYCGNWYGKQKCWILAKYILWIKGSRSLPSFWFNTKVETCIGVHEKICYRNSTVPAYQENIWPQYSIVLLYWRFFEFLAVGYFPGCYWQLLVDFTIKLEQNQSTHLVVTVSELLLLSLTLELQAQV